MPSLELPIDEFDCLHDVPVFKEHVLDMPHPDNPDEMIHDCYGKEELQHIVDNNNRKIEDTGDYVPIVITHTDRENAQHHPEVVGYAGPFKLGKFGNSKPVWAILAENWYIRKEHADKVKGYPRRSVELWRKKDYKDRFFDPISLLGAHTPQLDLGLLYHRATDKTPIIRYSAVMPSACNTFVPGDNSQKKQYQHDIGSPESANNPDSGDSDMGPSVDEIVNALEQTDVFQWVRQKMAAEGGGAPGGAPGAGGPPPGMDAPGGDAPMAPPAGGPPPGGPPPAAGDDKDKMPNADPSADEQKMPYSANPDEKVRYAMLERENRDLKARVEGIERNARQVTRYSQLERLSLTHRFNPDEEIKECVDLTQEQFDKHVNRIIQHYEKIPAGGQYALPYEKPQLRVSDSQQEREIAEISKAAQDYAISERERGNKIDYAAAREHVIQMRKQKASA